MARFWSEAFDPQRHPRDHMRFVGAGNLSGWIDPPRDRLIEKRVYFVAVCGFVFEFASLARVSEVLRFYEQRIHPSSRSEPTPYERYWQSWQERLPLWLREEPKRLRVVKALNQAVRVFAAGKERHAEPGAPVNRGRKTGPNH